MKTETKRAWDGTRWARLVAFLGVCAVALASGHAQAQDADESAGGSGGEGGADDGLPLPSIKPLEKIDVVRGSPVTINGKLLPKPSAITVLLGGVDIGHPIAVANEQTELVFVIPDGSKGPAAPFATLPIKVKIEVPISEAPFTSSVDFRAGAVTVVSEILTPLKLLALDPPVVAPDTKRLLITGEGFGGAGADYTLLRDGVEVPLCWDDSAPKPCVRARFNSAYELELSGPFDSAWRHEGGVTLTLRRGELTASGTLKPVRFIAHTRDQIRTWSVIASAAILGLLLLLITSGTQREIRAPGSAVRRVSTLFLDPATDTYSLAKCQLVAWSVAGLFSYAYLTLAQTLGQGIGTMAEVPENLPYMLLISGGTTMVSIGISSSKGPKGAGAVHPSLADLVGSGGTVSSERLLFAMWTLAAIASYLFMVFRADPTTLSELPAIPERLVALQGITAAAYLGGKGARSAGPVIDEITAVVLTGGVQFTLLGSCLHTNATVQIEKISITPFLDPEKHANGRPEVLNADPATGFSSSMKLVLAACAPEWRDKDSLSLTVVNPDGQEAAWSVTVDDALKEHLKMLPPSLNSARPPQDDV